MLATERIFRSILSDMVAMDYMSVEDILAIVDDWGRGDANSDDVALLSKVEPGWFAFARGKFSPYPEAYPNCQGVVGWVNPDKNAPKGQRGLIVIPEQVVQVWSVEACVVGVTDEEDGQGNTKKILAYAREKNCFFGAALFCGMYCKNGVRQGECFLPARRQLERIYDNESVINPSLEAIDGDSFKGNICSSTEYDEKNVVCVMDPGGLFDILSKEYGKEYAVRGVIAF